MSKNERKSAVKQKFCSAFLLIYKKELNNSRKNSKLICTIVCHLKKIKL